MIGYVPSGAHSTKGGSLSKFAGFRKGSDRMKIVDWVSSTKVVALFLGASFAGVPPIRAAIEVGEGFLIPELGLRSTYTTNAQASAEGTWDWINSVRPSIGYEGVGGTWSRRFDLGADFVTYANRDQDNLSPYVSGSLAYPRGLDLPYGFGVTGSIRESTGGDVELGRVTTNRNYSLSTSGSYRFLPHYSVISGFSYGRNEPVDDTDGGGQSTVTSFSIPLTVSYLYSETLSFGGGYRFGIQTSDADTRPSDSILHTVFANAVGKILPLVSSDLAIGVQLEQEEDQSDEDPTGEGAVIRNDSRDEDNVGPYAAGGLTWQATSLTSVRLGLSAGFSLTTGGRNSRTVSVDAGLRHEFDTNLSGSLSAGWSRTDFSEPGGFDLGEREDTSWDFGGGLGTTVFEHTNLGLSMNYRINNSNEEESQFNAFSITLSASRPF